MRLSETEINVEHTDRRVCVKRSNTTRPPLPVFESRCLGAEKQVRWGCNVLALGDKWVDDAGNYLLKDDSALEMEAQRKGNVKNVPTTSLLCLSTCTNTPNSRTGDSTVFRRFLHTSLSWIFERKELTESGITPPFDTQLYHTRLDALKI